MYSARMAYEISHALKAHTEAVEEFMRMGGDATLAVTRATKLASPIEYGGTQYTHGSVGRFLRPDDGLVASKRSMIHFTPSLTVALTHPSNALSAFNVEVGFAEFALSEPFLPKGRPIIPRWPDLLVPVEYVIGQDSRPHVLRDQKPLREGNLGVRSEKGKLVEQAAQVVDATLHALSARGLARVIRTARVY